MSGLAVLLAVLGLGLEAPVQAATSSSFGRFETLRAQDLRVAQVTYRLSIANAAMCRNALAPQPGLILHSLEQYGPADREEAARRFGLGPNVGVMAVVAGSPAEKAGLATGDQLISVNGKVLGAEPPVTIGRPTRASVERAQQSLAGEMNKGEVTLRISRASGFHEIRFTAEMGCSSNVELAPGEEVNAWADGARVVVSAGILGHCRTDDELALVIGHELAHNILHHGQGRGSAGLILATPGSNAAEMREEEEADRLAVKMVAVAAYDLSKAESFLARLMEVNGAVPVAATHPSPERRLALLKAGIAAAGA